MTSDKPKLPDATPGETPPASEAAQPVDTAEVRPPATTRPKFSRELEELAARFDQRPVCLADLLHTTQGRGFNLLLVFISLPFLTPLPLPGLSVPFGLVVLFIGARMALGKKPWLPQRLLQRQMPPQFLGKVLRAATRVVRFLEWFLRPRLAFLHDQFIYRRLAGAMIALAGVFLLLPLPVPFSNTLPAWTILLLAAAALERDGLCFLAGGFLFLATVGFFALLAFGGTQAVERFWPFGGAG
ncbi:MAG: exopolysaccharide biosynthesis protein [Verrucomicrobia bacterium]|nr:exopolysaccharide biosynthesis protein [Verrucomicrobiota bacterium]